MRCSDPFIPEKLKVRSRPVPTQPSGNLHIPGVGRRWSQITSVLEIQENEAKIVASLQLASIDTAIDGSQSTRWFCAVAHEGHQVRRAGRFADRDPSLFSEQKLERCLKTRESRKTAVRRGLQHVVFLEDQAEQHLIKLSKHFSPHSTARAILLWNKLKKEKGKQRRAQTAEDTALTANDSEKRFQRLSKQFPLVLL